MVGMWCWISASGGALHVCEVMATALEWTSDIMDIIQSANLFSTVSTTFTCGACSDHNTI